MTTFGLIGEPTVKMAPESPSMLCDLAGALAAACSAAHAWERRAFQIMR